MATGVDSYADRLPTPQTVRQTDIATTSSARASFPAGVNISIETPLRDDDYDRGTGVVTMHNALMPFTDSDCREQHRTSAYLTRTTVRTPKRAYPITPTAIAEGVEVLRSLLALQAAYPETDRDQCLNDHGDLCGSILFKSAWGAMQRTLGGLGARHPSLEQLTSTVLAIFQQTASPLELPRSAENNAIELALSGPYLRWETIGMCFVRIGLHSGATSVRVLPQTPHGPGGGRSSVDRQRVMLEAFNACMQTRTFCNQAEQTNDLTLWLLVAALTLATWCFGDDSSRAWNLMGDLSSAIGALGFHKGFKKGSSSELERPYLGQLRKRVLALAHERDKEVATFVGRPPRLSHRYYTVDLPLDLPDSVITGPVEELESAKVTLDEKGWSRDGVVNPVSRLRAIVLLSVVREEVLELSLGPPMPNIPQKARKIISKLESTWESIPHRHDAQSISDDMLPSAIWGAVGPRLEYLYTKFLLYKLLIGQTKGNRDKVIQISQEILHIALSLLKKTGLIATPNLEAMMVFYAMPCASILILELLRQHNNPDQRATFNRSDVIQDISVLVSYCDSLAISGQSNYQICKQAQTVFSRCLDQILNTTTVSFYNYNSDPSWPAVQEAFSLGSLDFGLTERYPQDPDWSTWLESFELHET